MELFLLSSAFTCLLGFLTVVLYVSWRQAQRLLRTRKGVPQWMNTAYPKVSATVERPSSWGKYDRRLTGAGNIDEQLQKVVSYGLRDYVHQWYRHISPEPEFVCIAHQTLDRVIREIACRSKEADILTFFTHTLVEDFSEQLTAYKKALAAGTSDCEQAFFEGELPGDAWSAVCCHQKATEAYLQRLSELLLWLVIPEEEFADPTLQVFLRDLMVWQVWLPLLHTLTQADNINSTFLTLCRDSSLTVESFLSAVPNGLSESERTALGVCLQSEIERLQKTGITEAHQQTLGALDCLLDSLHEGEPGERSETDDSSSLLTLTTTISDYSVLQDSGGRYAVYHVHVKCQHTQVPVVEEWVTKRRYSDFHDLHLTLRTQVGNVPPLPAHRSFHKLDPQLLEGRREALQSYLQELVSEAFLTAHPQALAPIILFLSQEMYSHSSTELTRKAVVERYTLVGKCLPLGSCWYHPVVVVNSKSRSLHTLVDSLVQPFRRNARETASTTKPTSSPKSQRRLLPPQSQVEGKAEEEEEVPLRVLLVLLDEVFDLRDQGQWLRRQLTILLKQLAGDKLSRRVVETIDWLTSPEQVAEYIRDLSNTLWPGGYPASPQPPSPESTRAIRAILARAKLIGSVPDDLRRFIGGDRTAKGMSRLFGMFQCERLNCRLALKLLESLMDSLFPARNLKEELRKLRCEIEENYS